MFQPWRFKLKEAEAALEQGRLEDAARLLREGDLPTYLPAQQLLSQVAVKLGARAALRARGGDLEAAWRDLDASRNLSGETTDWLTAHKGVMECALEVVVNHLRGNDFDGAIAQLERLSKRKPAGGTIAALREVTRRLDSARKLSLRGKFADAEAQLLAASALQPNLAFVADQKQLCRERGERCRLLSEQLHRALAASDWTAAVATADSILEFAPENPVARDARKRAWNEVGAKVADSRAAGGRAVQETQHWPGGGATTKTPKEDVETDRPRAPRFLLWIDGVGGYLVCLGDEVVIGQAYPGSKADMAIQADISRRHVKVRREGEGYILDPLHERVKVDGKPVSSPMLLSDGDELELGEGVRLRFRKPHVLSASARLEMVSHHRTQPHVDGILLMAESCVLGPKWQNHVVCREWKGDVVLFRQEEKLFCRAMESIEIDGKLHDGRGRLAPNSHVLGTDFSLTIEPVA
ncbi:MAG: FHA domain-containing protein [Pirellulaceae bacterium]